MFEIDEVVPPPKKAKKVDDATMLKRLKALEESQTKVWRKTARRGAGKVRSSILIPGCVVAHHREGVQASLGKATNVDKHGLSISPCLSKHVNHAQECRRATKDIQGRGK